MKRTTRIVIVTGAALAVIGSGAATLAATGDDSATVQGDQLQRATAAARTAAGGGTVTEVDTDGGGGYEVEVRLDDGTQVDVDLGADFAVLRTSHESPESDDENAGNDDDDRAMSDTDLHRATEVALAESGAGTVIGVEHDADGWDIEVRLDNGAEVDVDLNEDFTVRTVERDD